MFVLIRDRNQVFGEEKSCPSFSFLYLVDFVLSPSVDPAGLSSGLGVVGHFSTGSSGEATDNP